MQKHVIETLVGAVVLLAAAGFLVFAYKGSGMGADRSGGYVLKARFANATGINPGSDVRVGGIKVGSVSDMQLDAQTYEAIAVMRIDDATKIPADSTAAIVGSGLLGDKFVQISPGGDERMFESGGIIRFTQSAVSLEELIGKFVFSGGGVSKSGDAPAAPPEPQAN